MRIISKEKRFISVSQGFRVSPRGLTLRGLPLNPFLFSYRQSYVRML